MFSDVKYGWAKFKFLDFTGDVSYLTDPIFEIGEAFIKGYGVINMDEEGSDFDFIISNNEVFLVAHRDIHKLYIDDDITIKSIVKEFVNDIERDLEDWANWGYEDYNETIKNNRKEKIINMIKTIKLKYNIDF